jgi:phospholipase/carboxylesterase
MRTPGKIALQCAIRGAFSDATGRYGGEAAAIMTSGNLEYELRPSAGDPEGALILMHGRGVDQFDLAPLLDILDPQQRLLGITPGGPITDLPPGGRHWYAIRQVGFPDPATFRLTYGQLTGFLDDLLEERGVGWERTILGGFSQGGVMAYACGLGHGRLRPAGILALSCFIPEVEGWSPDPELARGLPVFHAHGVADNVIPVEFARKARDTLTALGADLSYHETPMPHAIDPRLLPEAAEWVLERTP